VTLIELQKLTEQLKAVAEGIDQPLTADVLARKARAEGELFSGDETFLSLLQCAQACELAQGAINRFVHTMASHEQIAAARAAVGERGS
jgi:hypothetical protein